MAQSHCGEGYWQILSNVSHKNETNQLNPIVNHIFFQAQIKREYPGFKGGQLRGGGEIYMQKYVLFKC